MDVLGTLLGVYLLFGLIIVVCAYVVDIVDLIAVEFRWGQDTWWGYIFTMVVAAVYVAVAWPYWGWVFIREFRNG